tara:strand:- start:63 stop:521 length:459 start_codon:yes stop_codon:yes gene_type:complete
VDIEKAIAILEKQSQCREEAKEEIGSMNGGEYLEYRDTLFLKEFGKDWFIILELAESVELAYSYSVKEKEDEKIIGKLEVKVKDLKKVTTGTSSCDKCKWKSLLYKEHKREPWLVGTSVLNCGYKRSPCFGQRVPAVFSCKYFATEKLVSDG